jgi:hypothetical protein
MAFELHDPSTQAEEIYLRTALLTLLPYEGFRASLATFLTNPVIEEFCFSLEEQQCS